MQGVVVVVLLVVVETESVNRVCSCLSLFFFFKQLCVFVFQKLRNSLFFSCGSVDTTFSLFFLLPSLCTNIAFFYTDLGFHFFPLSSSSSSSFAEKIESVQKYF